MRFGRDRAGSSAQVAPENASEIQALVPEISRFVEGARGLKFKEPVKVTLVDRKAMTDFLFSEAPDAEELKEIESAERILEVLGLIPRGTDLRKSFEKLYSAAVLGVYDSKKKQLLVRGDSVTAMTKVTLAHELTHALQDQHFGLDREELEDRHDESIDGWEALVEGDAVRIQEQYRESLPPQEAKASEIEEAEFGAGVPRDIPRVLLSFAIFPYATGPQFVESLVGAGGTARLDSAFAQPPVTTEQILHPEVFLGAQPVIDVGDPAVAGTKIDEGMFGELTWLVLFAESGLSSAARDAAGWGGDRYVAWRNGEKVCVRDRVALDTTEDARQFRDGVAQVAKKVNGLVVTGAGSAGDPFTITACG